MTGADPDSSQTLTRRRALVAVGLTGLGIGATVYSQRGDETPNSPDDETPQPDNPTPDTPVDPEDEHDHIEDDEPDVDYTEVNVVEHSKIDHTGDLASELLAFLDSVDSINHHFVLPDGTYTWDTMLAVPHFDYLGIVGEGDVMLDITQQIDTPFQLGRWDRTGAKHVKLSNFTVDIRGTRQDGHRIDAGLLNANIEHYAKVTDVTLVGQRGYAQPNGGGDKYTFLLNMVDENGEGHVTNVRLPDGEELLTDSQFDHSIGFSADPPHRGTNYYTDCHIEDFTDNGYYMAWSPGKTILTNCTATNNYGTNIRLGKHDECHGGGIHIDGSRDDDGSLSGAGIWLNEGSPLVDGLTIEAPAARNDLIRVNADADGGTVRNVTVNVGAESDVRAIRFTQDAETTTDPLLLENVNVNDRVEYNNGERRFAVMVSRENVTFRNFTLSIEESDALREGVHVSHPDVTFENCRFTTANTGSILELASNNTAFRNGELRGTGASDARFAVTGGIDPATVSIAGTTLNNVSFTDWADTEIVEADLR